MVGRDGGLSVARSTTSVRVLIPDLFESDKVCPYVCALFRTLTVVRGRAGLTNVVLGSAPEVTSEERKKDDRMLLKQSAHAS